MVLRSRELRRTRPTAWSPFLSDTESHSNPTGLLSIVFLYRMHQPGACQKSISSIRRNARLIALGALPHRRLTLRGASPAGVEPGERGIVISVRDTTLLRWRSG